jgi:hypothetical protein
VAPQKYLAMTVAVSGALALVGCAQAHHTGTKTSAGTSGHKTKVDAGKASVGTKAIAKLEPIPGAGSGAQPSDAGTMRPLSGTATFNQRADGVNVMITLGCGLQKSYDVFILDGGDCEPATLMGPHWDVPRGEGLPQVSCMGAGGGGRAFSIRASSDPKPWTIDGPPASDLVGHAIAVYAAGDSTHALACGVIGAGEPPAMASVDGGAGTAPPPSVEVRAALSGLCLAKMVVRSNTQDCPDPVQYEACVSANCDLAPCLLACSRYTACLEAAPSPCGTTCGAELDLPCGACMNEITSCALGFCTDRFACAAPIAPDGPCARLEACCGMQGDSAASCLDTVHLLEKLSGDPSCKGAMLDWDTTAHLPVPCNFQ